MFKIKTMAAAIALGVGLAGAAQAGTVTFGFDPLGTGSTANTYGTIDQSPGNVLAIDGGIPKLALGSKVTDLYQANLGSMIGSSSSWLNGTDGKYFTFAAGFGETVVGVGTGFAQFAFDGSNTTNFFEMNLQAAAGNDLTGTGFTSATALKNIIKGHIVDVGTNFSIVNPIVALDNYKTNDYPNVQTYTGFGGGSLTLVIDYLDTNYFTDLDATKQLIFSLFSTSLNDPFNQVDPSAKFSSTGAANGDVESGIGPVNALGNNFQFQADGSSSFFIPEPASLALMGLGLFGLGGFSRKRRQ